MPSLLFRLGAALNSPARLLECQVLPEEGRLLQGSTGCQPSWLSAAIMSQARSSRADTSGGEPAGACSIKTDTLGKAGAWLWYKRAARQVPP